MRRPTRLLTALALAAPCLAAEDTVRYTTSGDEEVSAFLAAPAGKGPHAAVIVIQEWWGLNE